MRRLMCVTAHPDDEAGGFGGSLRLYRDRGVESCVLCLTPRQRATYRGAARTDQDVAAVRRKEIAASGEVMQVSRRFIHDHPDDQLNRLTVDNGMRKVANYH